jgi:hypothetical protein
MKKKTIKQSALIIFASLVLVACDKSQSIPGLSDKHVILANGVNFDSGELVVLNTITGKQVQPCDSSTIKENNHSSTGGYHSDSTQTEKLNNSKCDIQIIDPSEFLQNAISSGDKVVNGTVLKNGKKIPARFFITVTALFPSSYCSTLYGSGAQYDQCIKKFPTR